MKKYILTSETIEVGALTLHRVVALKDFADVKTGDFGGFVENESNLSHDGDCWVYGEARIDGNAYVYDNAKVMDNANVCDNARVCGNAVVCDNAVILHHSHVSGEAKIMGDTLLQDKAFVSGHGIVRDAVVEDRARVYGKAKVIDSVIKNNARIGDNASIYGDAVISGNACVFGHATVSGVNIGEFALITSNAKVQSNKDFMFSAIYSHVTFFRCEDYSIKVVVYGNKEHGMVYRLDKFINLLPSLSDRKRKICFALYQLADAYMDK